MDEGTLPTERGSERADIVIKCSSFKHDKIKNLTSYIYLTLKTFAST